MKKIFNSKYILYMFLPVVADALGVMFLLGDSIANYALGGVCMVVAICLFFCIVLLVPHSYIIDKEGIKIFYRIKRCNYISWIDIVGINTRVDMLFNNSFFCKDYVISHNNKKRSGRTIDTVIKTKKTTAMIEKYWWKSIDEISF